jgi:hypothetical protein
MPIFHVVDSEREILFVTRSGSILTQDEEAARRQREADPRIVPGMAVLVDCRAVEPPDSPQVVRYLADNIERLAARLRCGPVAVVVSGDAEYGMARMYQSLTDPVHPQTLVFRDYDQALRWLRARPRNGAAA